MCGTTLKIHGLACGFRGEDIGMLVHPLVYDSFALCVMCLLWPPEKRLLIVRPDSHLVPTDACTVPHYLDVCVSA